MSKCFVYKTDTGKSVLRSNHIVQGYSPKIIISWKENKSGCCFSASMVYLSWKM